MRLRAFPWVLALTLAPVCAASAQERLSDLVLQLERLQQEVQELRGRVELQQHELSSLKRQQREQYMDLDARLGNQPARQAQPTADGAGQDADMAAPVDAASASPPAISDKPPRSALQTSTTPTDEKQAYLVAFDLLKKRRYDEAERAFEDLLARYPNGEYADNARYWLGESHYVSRDYDVALTQFQRVLANYPLSPKVPGSMLKIGYIHYDQADWSRARTTFEDVIKKFPGTTEARLAESRLERMRREGH